MARKVDDNVEIPGRGYNTDDVKAMKEETRRGRGRRWGLMALATIVLIPGLLFALWSFITLSMSYSTGDRAGYVQKFSKKGWLCKTWEGELAMVSIPGSTPERFPFTVRNEAVARELERLIGERVAITYEQKRGIPTTCFGETQYYVTAVRQVGGFGTPTPGATAVPQPTVPQAGTPAPPR